VILDFYDVNEQLKQILLAREPASVLRLCNTTTYAIGCVLRGEIPSTQYYNDLVQIEGGIFPFNTEFVIKDTLPKIISTINNCDLLGLVDVSNWNSKIPQPIYMERYSHKKIFSGRQFEVLDPGAILGVSDFKKLDDPWTKYLKDKRVLVVSTHVESIKSQWKNIDAIWGDNREIIAPFKLVDVIRTPYHPVYDDRQFPNCPTWYDTIEAIKRQIDQYDFDVLMVASSVSSPFYVDYAKQIGKIGLQIGGVLQLYFGVLGGRWDSVEGYKNWRSLFNENWIRPMEIDKPNKRHKFHFETNFAYW
jgi:hypothetical protein